MNTESFMAITANFIREHFELKSVLLQCTEMKGQLTTETFGT